MRVSIVTASSLALAALVVAGGLLGRSDGAAAEGRRFLGGSPGFGWRVAGTYLGRFDLGGNEIVLLSTLGADGSVLTTDSEDFSLGPVTGDLFDSPKHGSWKRIGRREIVTKQLELSYDPNGALILITRLTAVVNFVDASFGTAEAELDIEVFTADQDVLDPDAVPIAVVAGIPATLRRVPAE